MFEKNVTPSLTNGELLSLGERGNPTEALAQYTDPEQNPKRCNKHQR